MTDGRRVDYERLEPPSDQKCLTIIVRAANMARAQHYPQVIAQSTSHTYRYRESIYILFVLLCTATSKTRQMGIRIYIYVDSILFPINSFPFHSYSFFMEAKYMCIHKKYLSVVIHGTNGQR